MQLLYHLPSIFHNLMFLMVVNLYHHRCRLFLECNKNLQLQMLMVYFLGDRFDGFMWFSNAGRGRATDPLTSKPQTGKP